MTVFITVIDVKEALTDTQFHRKIKCLIEVVGKEILYTDTSKMAQRHGFQICGVNTYAVAEELRNPVKIEKKKPKITKMKKLGKGE